MLRSRVCRNIAVGCLVPKVTIHSDHNPLLYLTESAPKSSRLMRWALTLQEYDVGFKYQCGRTNTAADFLSRVGYGSPGTLDFDLISGI